MQIEKEVKIFPCDRTKSRTITPLLAVSLKRPRLDSSKTRVNLSHGKAWPTPLICRVQIINFFNESTMSRQQTMAIIKEHLLIQVLAFSKTNSKRIHDSSSTLIHWIHWCHTPKNCSSLERLNKQRRVKGRASKDNLIITSSVHNQEIEDLKKAEVL